MGKNFPHVQITVRLVRDVSAATSKSLTSLTTNEIGWRLGNDGVAYSPTGTLPTGVTAEAIIAYVGNVPNYFSHFIAIALVDVVPSTTYYYWAYMYDGFDYCLSNVGTFTTPKMDIERVVPIEILEPMEPYIPIYEGEKTVEWRSWNTNYRGDLLICGNSSGSGLPRVMKDASEFSEPIVATAS